MTAPRATYLIAAGAAFLLFGCGPSDPVDDRASVLLDAVFDSLRADTTTIGRRGGKWISDIRAAQLSASGEVIVLARHAPFVRVYSSSGQLRAEFLEMGDGPGETRHPHAMAVSDRGQILVIDGTKLHILTLDGRHLAAVQTRGMAVAAARNPCGDGWILYGPLDNEVDGRRPWFATVEVDSQYSLLHPALLDTLVAPRGGYGKQVLASGGGAVLMHEAAVPPIGIWYACDGTDRLKETTRWLLHSTEQEEGAQLTVSNGSWSRAGAADLGRSIITVENELIDIANSLRATRYTVITAQTRRVIEVEDGYTVYDARVGMGVLVGSSEPVPHLAVIPETLFAGADQ